MKTLAICLFALLLNPSPTATKTTFLKHLGDLIATSSNHLEDKISQWLNLRKEHIKKSISNDTEESINKTLFEYQDVLKTVENDVNKMLGALKKKIQNSYLKSVQDVSNLVDFLDRKDPEDICMIEILSNYVDLKIDTLNRIRQCSILGSTIGSTIIKNFQISKLNLQNDIAETIGYLNMYNNKNESSPVVSTRSEDRKLKLFQDDLKDVIAQLHAIHSRTSVDLIKTRADTQSCFGTAIDRARSDVIVLEHSDCMLSVGNLQ